MATWPKTALLALLTTLCASTAPAQPQSDTGAFAQHMSRYHSLGRALNSDDLKSIQTEYLAWLNTRVTSARTIDQMNAELAAANLTDTSDRRNSSTGFVRRIQPGRENGSPDTLNLPADVMTFVLGIYTGPACSWDDTLVLYSRATRQRLGWINAGTPYEPGYHFGAVTAGPPGPNGARLVATDWIASGCFYTYRQVFRIDSVAREKVTPILAHISREAIDYSTKILLDRDTVDFEFDAGYSTDGRLRLSVERYQVQGIRALRVPPIGQSVHEFVWEWQRLDDSDAARFGSPAAAAQHHGVMTVDKYLGPTLAATECPGAPPGVPELRGDWPGAKRFAYFRVSGTTPETYRMDYVGDKTICDSLVLPPPQSDTVRFAQHMARYRTPDRDLTSAELKSIQAEYLAWLNARVTAARSVEEMNIELNSAKLLFMTNESNYVESHTGFVEPIRLTPLTAPPEAVKTPEDLMLFLLPIYTGRGCNFDETLVLYRRPTRQRIGWLNAERAYEHGYYLGAITAEPQGPDGTRFIAADWIASNCTSNWNGQIFRIDSLANGRSMQILAHSPPSAYGGSTQIKIDRDTVQFTYASMASVANPDDPGPAPVERYRVQGNQALRIGPIAHTLEDFMEEWLFAQGSDAPRFGSLAAARQHNLLRARTRREWYSLTQATDCSGTPSTHEVRALWDKSKQTTFFRVSGATAATLRMESVGESPTPGCRLSNLDDIHQLLP